jgi:hypothetical protein
MIEIFCAEDRRTGLGGRGDNHISLSLWRKALYRRVHPVVAHFAFTAQTISVA